MKHYYYSIYDQKLEEFVNPFPCPTDGLATRSVRDALRKPDEPFAKYPEDYSLWKLNACYDSKSGTFVQESTPEKLLEFTSLVEKN